MDAGVMTSLAKETGHKVDEMEFLEKMIDYLSKVFKEDIVPNARISGSISWC